MRVLVTGGGGFIGRHLGLLLTRLGHAVTSYDNANLGLGRTVFGSVLAKDELAHHVRQADAVIHAAAVVGFKNVMADTALTVRTEVLGMEHLLDALRSHPVPTVYLSSSAVYGKGSVTDPAAREDGPFTLASPKTSSTHYAYGKLAAECLVQAAVVADDLPIRVARLFNVAGPGQSRLAGFVIPRMVWSALHGRALEVYTPGLQRRTFAHVTDVAQGIVDLLFRDVPPGTAVNLGGTDTVTMRQLAARVMQHVPTGPAYREVPSPYGPGYEEVMDRRPDLTLATALLGYQPQFTLDDILHDVVGETREALGWAA